MRPTWRAADELTLPHWMGSTQLFTLVLLVTALVVGIAVTKVSLLTLMLLALGAGTIGVLLVRWPELTPALFWLVYSAQSTVLTGLSVTGMYYPLYGLMALNAFVALARRRLVIGWRLLPYALFLLVVLASLLQVSGPLDFTVRQRLFIYLLGFLVFFQFPTDRLPTLLMRVQVLSMLMIVVWVVVTSIQGNFAYRGGISVDQNDVSFLAGFGLLTLLSLLAGRRLPLLLAAAVWAGLAGGVYALLLLASRGMSIAFAVAALTILGRSLLPARRSVPILLAVVLAGAVLVNLPGSDALIVRFQGANVSTANDRLPLWTASLHDIEHSSAVRILFGRGFASSMDMIRRVNPMLTSTHNVYIQMLYDFGVLGLTFFLAMHLALLGRFWRRRSTVTLFAGSVVVFMLMADLTITASDQFLYWVALGHLLALATALDLGRGEGPAEVPADAPPPLPAPRVPALERLGSGRPGWTPPPSEGDPS